ncbi:unnamed protein product [Cyclocybe aegerita]|uniref:Uncharacterized protein n=1 Tax=Cyclocybe aegerita TaxID=1973307 RepID=A0A8S0X3N0_CYCAE|nr:unnamed protein product [Cyclocybe aegerita]
MLDSFLWSRDLPLEVFVFNRTSVSDQTRESSDSQLQAANLEYARVQAITTALIPHVSRCKLLRFELVYPTSVPPAALFLQHHPTRLQELVLLPGGGKIPSLPFVVKVDCPWTISEFFTPLPSFRQLKCLVLDAFTFMSLGRAFKGSLKELKGWALRLEVSTYTFQPARMDPSSIRFTIEEFVDYLRTLRPEFLTLRDLLIANPKITHAEYLPTHAKHYSPIYVPLLFENVSKKIISKCLPVCDLQTDSITFRSCDIPPMDEFYALYLKLDHIPEWTDLEGVLELWEGRELTIKSSACFNDSLLAWLSDNRHCARHLDALKLYDCHSFSIEALKEFIDTRTQEIDEDSEEDSEDSDDDNEARDIREYTYRAEVKPSRMRIDHGLRDMLNTFRSQSTDTRV